MKTSAQVAKESGLSIARVNQFALTFGVEKFGVQYCWTDEQIEMLHSRIGKRGDKLSARVVE